MTDGLSDFWQHTVTVERYAGSGAFGDKFAVAATIVGFVDDTRKLVRDATGQEVVASATVFLPAATADVPVDSRVTLPTQFGGRPTRVITVARRDGGLLELPDHLEVHLL